MSNSARRQFLLLLILACWPLVARGQENPKVWGKTMEQWIAILRDPDTADQERAGAVRALGCFGPSAHEAVPDLVAMFQGPDGKPDPNVIDTLGQIGPTAAPAVPLLIQVFAKEECVLGKQGTFGISGHGNVQIALARIGEPAVPAVAKMLFDPNEEIHPCAADILAKIGPDAKAAVRDLIRAIQNPTPRHGTSTQYYAVLALGRIGPAAKEAIPLLNTMVGQENVTEALIAIGAPPVTRLTELVVHEGSTSAAEDLAEMGPNARAAAPALRQALKASDLWIRLSAAVALAGVDPPAPEALPVLLDLLENHPDEAVPDVPDALGRLGPAVKDALPRILRSGTYSFSTLVQIDVEGKECLPTLKAALWSDDDGEVNDAAECLSLLGPRAKGAIPDLIRVLTREYGGGPENYNARVSAARALVRLDPEGRLAIPALILALKREQSFRVREQAHVELDEEEKADIAPSYDSEAAEAFARALGCYGAAAKDAVPCLIEVLRNRVQEEDRWLARVEAALSLGQIGAGAKTAIPALREAATSRIFQISDAARIALVHVTPDGREAARAWIDSARNQEPLNQFMPPMLLRRIALISAALGESSFEGDLSTAYYMEIIDRMLRSKEVLNGDTIFVEEWFVNLGRLGWGAHKAIPRLRRALDHPNPWVRLWAREALMRIHPRR